MSFLPEVAVPESFEPFAALRESLGFVPNVFRAQTLLPRVIEAEAQIAAAILLRPSELSRIQKECILLAVAGAKRNTYCLTAHSHILHTLGTPQTLLDRIASDYLSADLPEADKTLLDFAVQLSQTPTVIGSGTVDNLRTQGFSDEQILEAVLMSALTNFLCTLSVGLGAEPDFQPWKLTQTLDSLPRVNGEAHKTSDFQTEQAKRPYLSKVEKSPDSFTPFAFFQEKFGFVPNIFRAQTLRPDVLEAEANAVGTVLLTEDVLSRFQKESILLVISASNLNTYCVAVHCEMLRALGVSPDDSDQIAVDHHYADLSDGDKGLLDFVLKLAERPEEFSVQDIETLRRHGFTEEQILESVVMTALTNFLNTLQMGLGTVPDFEPRLVFPQKEVNLSPETSHPILKRPLREESLCDDPDSKIVARVIAGETDAFEELVRRHGRRVYRSLVGILGGADEAEDALQDAFLKAFQHIGDFEGRSAFSTWLVRIGINTGVQRLRGRKDLDTLDDDSDEGFRPRQIQAWQDDPEQAYSKTEIRHLVEEGIMRLPSKYRVVIMLRDMEELSTEEAAEALGLGIPALKARLLRGRLMLREVLSPHFTKQKGGTTHA